MEKLRYMLALCFLFIMTTCTSQTEYKTKYLKLAINAKGEITSLQSLTNNKEYIAAGQSAPLLSLRIDNKIVPPSKALVKPTEIQLSYPYKNTTAQIKVQNKGDYITFELATINNSKDIDLVIWGPYPTNINETIGETVGVVRDEEFSLGIQSLNVKTLGGYPTYQNDADFSYDFRMRSGTTQKFRGQTAKPTQFGSVLQAYSRNRFNDFTTANVGYPKFLVRAYNEDGGVMNTKIALFGAPQAQTLSVISNIEIGENLPHPLLNGKWLKTDEGATASYMIIDFSESTIDEALQYTQQAGLRYLYSFNPFAGFGHLTLNSKNFPRGQASLVTIVNKAKQKNIGIGLHILSNFVSPSDAYVRPIPNQGLVKVNYSSLVNNVASKANNITIKDPEIFRPIAANHLNSIIIGDEIIVYKSVSSSTPWTLKDCSRGAYGTKASSHSTGDSVGLLADHEYKAFLGDIYLQHEMAKNIADFCKQTGISQLSFDGIEGCAFSGYGSYAVQKFVDTWYQNLSPTIKGTIINDASNPNHYFWHIASRMNWGEPWYGKFRESQMGSRLQNQAYFERNYFPHMLGWFKLDAQTSLSDIEWMLARAAGYDGGFGFTTTLDILRNHPQRNEILQAIKNWETARSKKLFNADLRTQFKDINNEYHLTLDKNNIYNLTPVNTTDYLTTAKGNAITSALKSPNNARNAVSSTGQIIDTTISYNNPFKQQEMQFTLSLNSSDPNAQWNNPQITINQNNVIIPVTLRSHQMLTFDGQQITISDNSQKVINTVKVPIQNLKINKGNNTIKLSGSSQSTGGVTAQLEIRSAGNALPLKP